MTGSNVLLDTNIVIDLFKGDLRLFHKLKNSKQIYLPNIVLGELLLGAYRSSNTTKHLSQIDGFRQNCLVLSTDADTAVAYAGVKASLLELGKPIPENDIWIAAISMQYDVILITRDAHFDLVPNLKVGKW